MAGETRSVAGYANAELIGRGGFGSVYRATDADHGREVAIKVLPGGLDDTGRRRFDRERQAMGRLGAHPNIVPVHDSGYTEDGEAYIVMELATGGSLHARLNRTGPLPWPEAGQIMTAIASAAQAAHDQGILHRDIKPDNILIDQYGNPKLSDFGIAAVASSSTSTSSTTATLAHAAPEVLEGQPATTAVDIYAVGSTLHHLISGLPPFMRPEDESVAPLINRTLHEPPPDLRVHGVPDAVARVAERAMAKRPADRYATAAQLASDLAAASGGSQPRGAATAIAPDVAHGLAGAGAGAGPASRPVQPNDPTVVANQTPARDHRDLGALAASPQTGPRPDPALSGTGGGRGGGGLAALWAVLAVIAVGLVGIVALVLLRTGSTDDPPPASDDTESAASSESVPDESVPDESASVATASGEPSGGGTSDVPLTASGADNDTSSPSSETTAPPLIEQDMTMRATASASSSSSDGFDACGETTTFGPSNVLDGRRDTAWRAPGDGVAEQIDLALDGSYLITSVGLVPGYVKLDQCDGSDRFTENRRVTEVRWTVGNEVFVQSLDPNLAELQRLALDEPVSAASVQMEILASTEPGGRDFVAISDIEIRGAPT